MANIYLYVGCGETSSEITASGTELILGHYPSNSDCGSIVKFSAGKLVKISFLFLDIEEEDCGWGCR